MRCICDPGFVGDGCMERLCPKAFDPITINNFPNRRSIRLTTGLVGGRLEGSMSFSFSGAYITLNADGNYMNSEVCSSKFNDLSSFGKVECERVEQNEEDGTASYIIQINEFPLVSALVSSSVHCSLTIVMMIIINTLTQLLLLPLFDNTLTSLSLSLLPSLSHYTLSQ